MLVVIQQFGLNNMQRLYEVRIEGESIRGRPLVKRINRLDEDYRKRLHELRGSAGTGKSGDVFAVNLTLRGQGTEKYTYI